MTNRASQLFFAGVLLLCSAFVQSQVTVAIAPDPHPQFTDGTGKPLAAGFLYTYQAGTSTLLNTYVDSSGIVQNPDPIPLDSTGAPSNGSTQTGIWLANTAYKFCAYNAALVQQWCTDNVTGYLGLLNLPNTWTSQQTLALPLIDTAIDNQFVVGVAGTQTTLDFPPPVSNVTLHFPTTSDTLIGRVTTDTLGNKTLNFPTLVQPTINSVFIANGPGAYEIYPNSAVTGTSNARLVQFTAAGVATPAISATGGVVGICVETCGTAGGATVQESGASQCQYDGSIVAGDYVQISPTIQGDCHDAGNGYPSTGQIIGRAPTTNSGAGEYGLILFGPELRPNVAMGGSAGQVLVSNGTTGVFSNIGGQHVVASLTVGGSSGAGAAVTCAGTCNDNGGYVQLVTGTGTGTSTFAWAVTFGTSHVNSNCSFSPSNAAAANLSTAAQVWISSSSATSFSVFPGASALTASTTYLWTYTCNFT